MCWLYLLLSSTTFYTLVWSHKLSATLGCYLCKFGICQNLVWFTIIFQYLILSGVVWSALIVWMSYYLHDSLSVRYYLLLSIMVWQICYYVLLAALPCYYWLLSAIIMEKTTMPHPKRTVSTHLPLQENAETTKWRTSHLFIKLLTGNLRANLRATTQNEIHFLRPQIASHEKSICFAAVRVHVAMPDRFMLLYVYALRCLIDSCC